MNRETDPVARSLLAVIMRLERKPWPEMMHRYGWALLALSIRCESRAGMAELFRWLSSELQGVLRSGVPEHRMDALTDIVCTAWSRLQKWRAGLDRKSRPNLVSMFRAAVLWRAKDLAVSSARHHRLQVEVGHMSASGDADPHRAAIAREVVVRLTEDATPASRALLLIGEGETIAAASRRAGVSRATVYRAMKLLAER